MKRTIFFIFLLLASFLALRTLSQAYYPATFWSSDRLPLHIVGVRAGKVVSGDETNLVALSPNKLVVYRISESKLVPVAEYAGGGRDSWIKLSLIDLDGNGADEIIVSGFYHEDTSSFVATVRDGKIQKIADAPYHLSAITWEGEPPRQGKKILVAQKRFGGDDFSGPLIEMGLNGGKLVKKREIILPGGISGESISLFSVAGLEPMEGKGGFLQLNSMGKLLHYVRQGDGKYKKEWTSGESYSAVFTALDITVRNMMNEVEKERFLVPVSFQIKAEDQPLPLVTLPPPSSPSPLQVYVVKNEGYLKNIVGPIPSVKNAQMVRLVWSGYGFQEDWNSPRLDGAISDFDIVDWDDDGTPEILAALLLRDKGYFDTLKKQDSLLIVLDLP